jgi:hypothetical protein
LMIEYDGMKILFPVSTSSNITIVNTSIISLNPPIASFDSSIMVHLIIINTDGMEFHEIIDIEINEKRRYNDIDKGIKLPEINPHSTDSELPHHQSNTQSVPSDT